MALQVGKDAPVWCTRYTAKAYDKDRPLTEKRIQRGYSILRMSPSSVNAQWTHFFVADTSQAKARLEPCLHAFNRDRVRDATLWIVFTVPTRPTEKHFQAVLAQEVADGRFSGVTRPVRGLDQSRRAFTQYHVEQRKDFLAWATDQAYLAAGFFVGCLASLDIDATLLEGVYFDALDRRLGLVEKGHRSVLMVAVGHASVLDRNATKPKSRLLPELLFTKVSA